MPKRPKFIVVGVWKRHMSKPWRIQYICHKWSPGIQSLHYTVIIHQSSLCVGFKSINWLTFALAGYSTQSTLHTVTVTTH